MLVIGLVLSSFSMWGQLTTADSTRTVQLWSLGPGYYVPASDLSTRFGSFASAGVEYRKKLRSGLVYGGAFEAFYGTNVKGVDEIFAPLSDGDGNFIGVNGEFAILQAGLSGGQVLAEMGWLWPGKYNPNSGSVFTQGFGMQQTKIGIRNERGNFPQLQPPMLYGYDRLHRGTVARSTWRYMHLDNAERINYSLGLVMNVAATKSVRGFNIDTGLPDTSLKFDMSWGVQFIWMLPVYAKQESFYLVD